MPRRIQRKRLKGWRLPAGAVVVTRPTRWGNPVDWREYEIRARDVPHTVDPKQFARQLATDEYRRMLMSGELPITVEDVRRDLRGRDLACWCPDSNCHAEVLLKIANS